MIGKKNMRAIPRQVTTNKTVRTRAMTIARMRENTKMVIPSAIKRKSGNPDKAVFVSRNAF